MEYHCHANKGRVKYPPRAHCRAETHWDRTKDATHGARGEVHTTSSPEPVQLSQASSTHMFSILTITVIGNCISTVFFKVCIKVFLMQTLECNRWGILFSALTWILPVSQPPLPDELRRLQDPAGKRVKSQEEPTCPDSTAFYSPCLEITVAVLPEYLQKKSFNCRSAPSLQYNIYYLLLLVTTEEKRGRLHLATLGSLINTLCRELDFATFNILHTKCVILSMSILGYQWFYHIYSIHVFKVPYNWY